MSKLKLLELILAFIGGLVTAAATIGASVLSNLDKVLDLLQEPPRVGEFRNLALAAKSTNGQTDKRTDCVSSQGRHFTFSQAKVVMLRQHGPRCENGITSATENEVCFHVTARPEDRVITVECLGYLQVPYAADQQQTWR